MTKQSGEITDERQRDFNKSYKKMGLAQTGDEITKSWHKDAVWFDLQFYRMKGLDNCRNEFNSQFSKISNVQTDFPEIEAFVYGNIGFVRSIQRFRCDDLNGKLMCVFNKTNRLLH